MRFWDTSALVPLFIDQPQTPLAKKIFEDDSEAVLWWATPVEYESALQRSRREAILDDQGVATARQSLSLFREGAVEVQASDDLRARAIRLLARHSLRGADALQLASALVWAGDALNESGFVSFDSRLREAAGSEGFIVLPDRL